MVTGPGQPSLPEQVTAYVAWCHEKLNPDTAAKAATVAILLGPAALDALDALVRAVFYDGHDHGWTEHAKEADR